MQRIRGWLALGACLALWAACGGPGGSDPEVGGTSEVVGRVLDDSGDVLANVWVACESDGKETWTDREGGFRFDVRSDVLLRLRFRDAATRDHSDRDDVDERDETPDRSDLRDGAVDIGRMRDGERCDVEVEMRDGQVVGYRIDRRSREGDEHEGESRLEPAEGSPEPEAVGEAELECREHCCRLEIEVARLHRTRLVHVLVVDEAGTETRLGSFEVDREGRGRLVIEACAGDRPTDATRPSEIAGLRLLLVDGEGRRLLVGRMPRPMEREHHEGESEDREEHDEHPAGDSEDDEHHDERR